ncbi:MAG: hypothetical protein A2168_02735 [Planctomycetes bacterium RBG_13_50_24]|nr:MAG: hypothetical protein A2168_02735 [Planctomycetes bacterium RBG_13_50_24]
MKRPDFKAFVLTLIFAVMLAAGCGTQEPLSVKKCRVIAAENTELRKKLERRDKELEIFKEDYSKEIKAQKNMLQTCLQEKEELKNKSRQNVRDQVKGVLDTVVVENKKLRDENTRLKAQIEELQKQPQ